MDYFVLHYDKVVISPMLVLSEISRPGGADKLPVLFLHSFLCPAEDVPNDQSPNQRSAEK